MAISVNPGYRGLIDLGGGGNYLRFSDASVAARQTVNIPDLIMGDHDHDAFNYGPIEVGGTIGGPMGEIFLAGGASSAWNWAVKRSSPCGELAAKDITLYYYCTGGADLNARTFTGMKVNSFGFSCAAGDVATFSLDVMAKSAGSWSNVPVPSFLSAEKLITWDKVSVQIGNTTPGDQGAMTNIGFSNFDFTVANNLTPVYAIADLSSLGYAPNLFPVDIVNGLRTITGTLSVYNTPQFNGYDYWDDYTGFPTGGVSNLTFNIGTLSVTMMVRFHRLEAASSVTPIISTVGFSGVGSQAALDA